MNDERQPSQNRPNPVSGSDVPRTDPEIIVFTQQYLFASDKFEEVYPVVWCFDDLVEDRSNEFYGLVNYRNLVQSFQ